MVALVTRRKAIAGAVASVIALPLVPKTPAAGQPTVHELKIQSFKFVPDRIRVRFGDVIKWTNEDLAPHTATADEFGWDTEELAKGASAEVTVVEGMETSYFCAFHPHMKGSFEIA
ncbi:MULTISPECIES: cupredoxin domain-containing protein [Roseobacteraceae]|uniref:cupredoxin domain-containing protein n=1 Tax=Roseobacteraceae TaxID=2854170 RepID=UPI000DE8A329|nr:cupredoxin domain-containing protein [Falsiruegeria litorea]MBT8167496.1 cupredoxin domain-containing protein [Falsiruegeria litorea]RBW57464.1 copper-binding protein [Ruegeria sp. A3M17]